MMPATGTPAPVRLRLLAVVGLVSVLLLAVMIGPFVVGVGA
jgi:hypothetical protein